MTGRAGDGSRLSALRAALAGRKVLLAGRNSFHLVYLTDLLLEAGCHVCGPFGALHEVSDAVAEDTPDAGIVDVGGTATRMLDIVAWLKDRQVSSVMVGDGPPGAPLSARIVTWPVAEADLLRALLTCIHAPASPPPGVAGGSVVVSESHTYWV